jgi:hypothetical protein
MDLGSTELDVALQYLLDQGFVEQAEEPDAYKITVPGMDRVRQERGG